MRPLPLAILMATAFSDRPHCDQRLAEEPTLARPANNSRSGSPGSGAHREERRKKAKAAAKSRRQQRKRR